MLSVFQFRDEFLPDRLKVLATRMFPGATLWSDIEAVLKENSFEDSRAEIPHALAMMTSLMMSLYRHEDIESAYLRTVGLIPGGRGAILSLCPGNIHRARARVQRSTYQKLLERIVRMIPVEPTFYGLIVAAMDGSKWTMPDTDENASAFGRSANQNGESMYPHLLAVGLITVYDRCLRKLKIYPGRTDEHKTVFDFLGDLTACHLLLLDRGFPSKELVKELQRLHIKYLARIDNTWPLTLVEEVSEGDTQVDFDGHRLRLIEFVVLKEKVRLLTNLPRHIPKAAFFELYHQRWLIETVWNYLKNIVSPARHGRQDLSLRSEKPEFIHQEMLSLGILYNLVAASGAQAAASVNREPGDYSFSKWMTMTRIAIENDLSPSERAIILTAPANELRKRRQKGRTYNRTVRPHRPKYQVDRERHCQQFYNREPTFGTNHTTLRAPPTPKTKGSRKVSAGTPNSSDASKSLRKRRQQPSPPLLPTEKATYGTDLAVTSLVCDRPDGHMVNSGKNAKGEISNRKLTHR